jgi:hypothetical protein
MMRVAVWLATTSLSFGAALPAIAQPAAPPGTDLAGQENTDPPPVAGSVAAISGTVSFHANGETTWSAATLNYPVTNGEGFWTEPHGSATIDIADDKVVLDESTEFDVVALDQSQFSATLAQGAIFIQLNSLAQGQTLSVNTPRGTVTIKQAGRYEIVAGDTNDATLVSVVDGAAHISASGMDLDIGPQQTASIGGSDTFQGTVGALQQDGFLQAQLRLVTSQVTAHVPRQVQYMTGGAELSSYGSYTQSQQYGQVWYPNNVARDWAPYRDGHWAYVQPWGWTWVDNARWGFAPFHYGRWVQVDDRWGWVAGGGGDDAAAYGDGGGGGYQYPVYSPALVSFVGVAAGVGIGISIGAGDYAPAWVPLGPREPYYPWYHVRNDYFERMNRPYGVPRDLIARGPSYYNNVHNTTIVNNTTIRQTFINQRAATVIPAAAFARGEGVMRAGRPLPEQAFAHARPLTGRLPVRPTAFTPNLAPEAARRFNVAVPEHPAGRVMAGPRIVQTAPGTRAVPELRRAALPQNIHAVPANQVRPAPGEARGNEAAGRPGLAGAPNAGRPGAGPEASHGLPQLRAPGATRPDVIPGGRPGEPGRPGAVRPGETASPGAHAPAVAGRPELRAPGAVPPGREARPGETRRGEVRPAELARPGSPAAPRPAEVPHPEAPRAGPRPEAPHAEAPRAATRPNAPHAPAHVEAPRAAPHAEAPRPAPHVEAPRPAPHVEAPRPAPHVEAPRPAPHVEAPRPAPRMEAPRPAPHIEAPRPAPAPRAAPPAHNDDKKPHR